MATLRTRLSIVIGLLALVSSSRVDGQWVQTNVPDSARVENFAIIGPNIIAGAYGDGIFLSTDKGMHWAQENSGLTDLRIQTLTESGGNVFAGSDGGVFMSADSGINWSPEHQGARHLACYGGKLFVAQEALNGVFFSIDSGRHWTSAVNGLPYYKSWHTWVSGFTVTITDLFAQTDYGLSKWNDSDSSWIPATFTLQFPVGNILVSGLNLLAQTSSDIFLSSDNGKSWIPAKNGLPLQPTINSLVAVDSIFFIATSGSGIFMTTSNSSQWTAENSGLTDTSILALTISGSQLLAGNYHGVWRRPLSEMIGTNAVPAQASAASSEIQSFPNPFTQSTTVRYTSTERGFAQVTIVNLLGEEVARLFDGPLEAGEHSFVWEAKDAAAGTYFCIVREGGAEAGGRHAALVVTR